MKNEDISRITMHRIIALSYKEENAKKIETFISESQNEEELIERLKKTFEKYETIQYVHAIPVLPTHEIIGIYCYSGEGVPEECTFTINYFLKTWQRGINRSPKQRERLDVKELNEKCPVCGGRVFANKNKPGNKWCSKFPDCRYYFNKQK